LVRQDKSIKIINDKDILEWRAAYDWQELLYRCCNKKI